MGSALVTGFFYGHQDLLVAAAGVTLILFGVPQLTGQGWAIGPLERLRGHVRGDSPGAVLALGAVSGLAGFCAGPVLGAVLTIAAASGDPLRGAVLLALYAAGMAAPLFIGLGVLFLAFDGTRTLTSPIPEAWEAGLQEAAAAVRVPDLQVVAGAGIALAVLIVQRLRKAGK